MSGTAAISSNQIAREINERIREQCKRFLLTPEDVAGFICECGCMRRFETTLAAYDVHDGLLLAPGHALDEADSLERSLAVARAFEQPVA